MWLEDIRCFYMCMLLQATAQLDLKRKELTCHLQKMGVGLGGLGKTFVTRTTDLFDQVCPCCFWHAAC